MISFLLLLAFDQIFASIDVDVREVPPLDPVFAMSTWFFQWDQGFYVYPSNSTKTPSLFTLRSYCPNWASSPYGEYKGDRFLDTFYSLGVGHSSYRLQYSNNVTKYIYVPVLGTGWKNYTGRYFLLDSQQNLEAYVPFQFDFGYNFDMMLPDQTVVVHATRTFGWATWHLQILTAKLNSVDVAVLTHLFESHRTDSKGSCTGMLFYGVPILSLIVIILLIGCCWVRYRRARGYEIINDRSGEN